MLLSAFVIHTDQYPIDGAAGEVIKAEIFHVIREGFGRTEKERAAVPDNPLTPDRISVVVAAVERAEDVYLSVRRKLFTRRAVLLFPLCPSFYVARITLPPHPYFNSLAFTPSSSEAIVSLSCAGDCASSAARFSIV